MVPKLLSLLTSMSNLKSLAITLPPSLDKAIDLAFDNRSYGGISHIDTLNIACFMSPCFYPSPESHVNTNEGQANRDIISSMLENLIGLTPFVQTLFLFGDFPPPVALMHAANLRQLVKLCLYLGKIEGTTFPLVTLEKVENIESSSMAILSSIHCPAAMHLLVTSSFSSELSFNLSLDVKTWSNLRTRRVEIPPSSWSGISLPQVEEISVDMPYNPKLGDGGSPLLEELALHTNSFPCLSRLRLQRFPEWDILFLMLERRNFPRVNSVQQSCKSIDSINLPFRPASWILKPLIDRLCGQLSVRPTDYELSYHAIAPIYFDRNM
jgi:hypothetical protein